jgi:hypothetical protein
MVKLSDQILLVVKINIFCVKDFNNIVLVYISIVTFKNFNQLFTI